VLWHDVSVISASQIARYYMDLHRKGKEKEEYYIAPFCILCTSQSSQEWITQFHLQIHHACLSFVNVHQMALPLTELTDIQLQIITHISTRKG